MAINQSSFTVTKREKRDIKRLAKNTGLSFSNYVRRCLGLEPLKHGGSRKKAEQPTEVDNVRTDSK